MDHHLDYGLRVHTEPKYKSLYSWAINEVGANGSPVGEDQIPWSHTLFFSATSCVLTNRFEIETPFSWKGESEEQPQIKADQIIRMTLQPAAWRGNSEVTFSMFGTKRAIRVFTLEVRPLDASAEAEHCNAWGNISYTIKAEDSADFRSETVDDCIWFYLHVKPETFALYIALIERGAINEILFSVSSVDGFYSGWSPSISTNEVKVLLRSDEHKFELPPDFQGEPPRLGRVRDARLLLHRRLELEKAPPAPAIGEADDPKPPLRSALQVTSEMDPRLLPVLTSLKKAAWIAVALLAVIAFIALQKH